MAYSNTSYGGYVSPKTQSKSYSSWNLGRDIKNLVLPIGFILVVLFAVIYIRNFFFSKKETERALDKVDADTARTMTQYMRNGKTYVEVATLIYDYMFNGSPVSWWKNTDEEALGALMLTVNMTEYSMLETTYRYIKDDKSSWYQIGNSGTLTEDLRSTFSKNEQKLYLSHLGLA